MIAFINKIKKGVALRQTCLGFKQFAQGEHGLAVYVSDCSGEAHGVCGAAACFATEVNVAHKALLSWGGAASRNFFFRVP